MKKSLLALAVLGAFAGAASAQTSVNVYGVVDLGIAHEDMGGATGSVTRMDSGIQSGSRLGFKGTEDLGGGMSASFVLENGINVDTGGFAQGNTSFGRQAWAGLNGGFGSVKLGRQYTPIFNAVDSIDPFGTGLAGDASRLLAHGGVRMNNTLSYTTPSMSGLWADFNYGFGEVNGNSSASRQFGTSVNYSNGPISAVLAYHDANNATDTNTTKNTLLGGTYNFGPAIAHLAYGVNKDDVGGAAGLDTRDMLVGVTVPFGASSVFGSYIRKDNRAISNADANQVAIGYTYALSKRTNLYTSYSRTDNDALAAYNVTTAGATDKLFNVGIRHKF